METINVVVSQKLLFPEIEELFQIVHLGRVPLEALRAEVEAWEGRVLAAHAGVPLLPALRYAAAFHGEPFAPVEAGRLIQPRPRFGPEAERFVPDVPRALKVLAEAGLGERCAYECGNADEDGVAFLDPAAGLWAAGMSMVRVPGPGDVDCFWVL